MTLKAKMPQRPMLITLLFSVLFFQWTTMGFTQQSNIPKGGKKISKDLFGLFFEDINYAADGGLYAELIQNRSFDYTPINKDWHSFSFWEYVSPWFSYGKTSIETSQPVHPHNPGYLVLDIQHIGDFIEESKRPSQQPLPPSVTIGRPGVGIKNTGFGNIIIKKGEQYNFSSFARLLSKTPIDLYATLQDKNGTLLAESKITVTHKNWNKYAATLTATAASDSAEFVLLATTKGQLAVDVISLFPENTFNKRTNGMRADLAQLLADMKPAFIRFPGGCLVHGNGVDNMYRWKETIGPIEQRKSQRNLWGYHQTMGLGYYEYFQFCEDIGAKPLPVLPAAVSCQNSGGTWRIGGTGQQALPLEEMQDYIQEVLDLVEWANGPATSTWGAKRAAAGHPEPFNLEYVGIGNEDKITPEFEERFKMISDAVKAKYPNIILIGTSGPFHSGEDFDKGWAFANSIQLPVVDEHYYSQPEWFISNQYRYDKYNRKQGKVYLGEYASWGNKQYNAIAEALFIVSLERNGDIVSMASYAPLFAKKGFTQWSTDMIFFDNTGYYLTPNYHVQKLFSLNAGDYYYDNVIKNNKADTLVGGSAVYDSKTGDIILKLANVSKENKQVNIDLSRFGKTNAVAEKTVLSGATDAANSFDQPNKIAPVTTTVAVSKKMSWTLEPMSFTVVRIKTK